MNLTRSYNLTATLLPRTRRLTASKRLGLPQGFGFFAIAKTFFNKIAVAKAI
jgi:hypothetical protein